ncbi:MAG: hypothetical protein KU38_12495 [Sulfurovum sp. FS08-3]|nr:MAG: hypothetical protein KU38_12495 [Sulfurovum sp. FS08-3]
MKHIELIQLLYQHRDIIDKAFMGESFDDLPKELVKDVPIFQKVAKKYELSEAYFEFANTMLKRVDANYRFGDYNEEIKLLIELKEIYQETTDKTILARMKSAVKTLYKKIEQRDTLINSRINDIVNDNELSIELIIKEAQDIDDRIGELIIAHSENLKILGTELRGLENSFDEILVDIRLDLIPLTQNIHTYNEKLSDFILRTQKRKRENKQLMAIANKIIKEQDHELKAMLLSNHQLYLHTFKENKRGLVKSFPEPYELKRESFLELLVKSLEIKRVEKKAIVSKPYEKSQDVIFKSINIKRIEKDICNSKPQNIFEYILSHDEIQKFKPENQEKIYAFKTYLTIVQNYRDNVVLESNYLNNVKVAKWI